jgi:hypothetical protein
MRGKTMRGLITILALILSMSALADSTTDCWTDGSGETHCTTKTYPEGDITPHW